MTEVETKLLRWLAQNEGSATHWLAKRCGLATTAQARRTMHRLAAKGLTEGIRAGRFGPIYWWKTTEAGRAAVAQIETEAA